MVKACRAHNVLVYNDMVVNHMAAGGNDVLSHCNGNDFWGPKASSTGAPYFGLEFTYGVDKDTGKIIAVEFPASAYGPLHFHCERSLNSWNDGMTLNAGWLVGRRILRRRTTTTATGLRRGSLRTLARVRRAFAWMPPSTSA